MEGGIMKKGLLYIQQQRFGKRWKKVWSVVYSESRFSVALMELHDFKPASAEDPSSLSKRVIRMRDCVRMIEVQLAHCPRGCGAFLLETTKKCFVFAAPSTELQDWIARLSALAFPFNSGLCGVQDCVSAQKISVRDSGQLEMVDNCLYDTPYRGRDFLVTVVSTVASNKCQLHGDYILTPESDQLVLRDLASKDVLFIWPYCFVRKFGQDQLAFSFEAGRRCDSGEGIFEFATSHGEQLYSMVNAAISSFRGPSQPSFSTEEDPCPAEDTEYSVYERLPTQTPGRGVAPKTENQIKGLTPSFRRLSLNAIKLPNKDQVRSISSCPPLALHESQDPVYAKIIHPKPQDHTLQEQRFHAAPKRMDFEHSKSFHFSSGASSNSSQASASDMLDGDGKCDQSIEEETDRADPIYYEAEGTLSTAVWDAASAVYDDPEELKGQESIFREDANKVEYDHTKDNCVYDNILLKGKRK
ncbi:docking protein 2 isoform X2 [Denticeps clupeoides]|uniref:docking protein 2 isoform X2 n=1 Tax=Denticeps clupeoides TaxID=299321 RepID=UPI0010A31549|nr:docking protein 2-like isoform X2 [Denticeps clupeoides]